MRACIARRNRPDYAPDQQRQRAAYSQAKLVKVMYTFALARRVAATQGTANFLRPGVVATNLLPGLVAHFESAHWSRDRPRGRSAKLDVPRVVKRGSSDEWLLFRRMPRRTTGLAVGMRCRVTRGGLEYE